MTSVAVPALPVATLVVTQTQGLLTVPEALLERPAQADQPHQPLLGPVRGAVAQVAFEFVRGVRGGVAAQQQPDVGTGAENSTGHYAQDGAEHGLPTLGAKAIASKLGVPTGVGCPVATMVGSGFSLWRTPS